MPRSKEYRAVYGSPSGSRTHGRPHANLYDAAHDQPERSMETLEEVVGVQVREVEPWRDMALGQLLKSMHDEAAEEKLGAGLPAPAPRAVRDEPQA